MSDAGSFDVHLAFALVAQLGRRPALWPAAIRQARRTTASGWWRQRPHLPVPPAAYRAFRLQTMYGGDGRVPASQAAAAADIIGWVAWTKEEARARPFASRGDVVVQRSVRVNALRRLWRSRASATSSSMRPE